MCTLTLVPRRNRDSRVEGFRLVFNRDEQLTRAPGTLPSIETHGEHQAILPRDPDSGGTWIAATDAGLAFALLNVNPPEKSKGPLGGASRGVVIPALLKSDSMESVADVLPAIVQEVLRPFRLVVTDGRTWLEALGTLGSVRCTAHLLVDAVMRTSSGLGDHVVEPVRRRQFESMFAGKDGDIESTQDAFHAFRFPGQDELSVDMLRADARTVSITVIDATERRIEVIHRSSAPRDDAGSTRFSLERRNRPGHGSGLTVQ